MTAPISDVNFAPLSAADADAAFAVDQRVSHSPWGLEIHRGSFAAPAFAAWGMYAAHQLVAFAYVHQVLDEAFLLQIAVDLPYQRRGVGQGLLQNVFAELRKRGSKVLSLEVRASNVAAQKLYARCGFTKLSVRRNYYQNPAEDALLMSVNLSA